MGTGTLRKSVQTVCGRALRGLYGGKTIRFGNNVSEQGGNKCVPPLRRCKTALRRLTQARARVRRRTRRSWKPNAVRKRVFSQLLDRMLPLSLTTHTLRCIDKAGGARPNAPRGLRLRVAAL